MKSTFNDTIVSQVLKYLQDVLTRVSKRDQKHRVLKLDSISVDDTEQLSIPELIAEGGTDCYVLNLIINCYDEAGNITNRNECILEVPRMNNNLFIIGGRYREPCNILGKDYRCRVWKDCILFNDLVSVRWTESQKGEFNPINFKVHIRDYDSGEMITLDCLPEILDKYEDLLKLDSYCINKLKVKLDRDDIPDHITFDLIKDLYELGNDSKRDNMIDWMIVNVETDLINHLNTWSLKKDIIGGIASQWFVTDSIFLTPLQNALIAYFRSAKSKFIEIPSQINPLVYDSLRYKVLLPSYMAFNTTLSDIIDASNTPENANVNILNEINVCVSIEKGVIMYTCYDYRTKAQVKLPYIEYLTKKVLKSECFDYDKMEVKQCDTYMYMLRQKMHKTDKLIDFDLIEPKPDDKLSLTTRRIPLINMSDSVRVSMGCAMCKQAIQTEGAEPRLVASGNDATDMAMSINLIRYSGLPGKVVDIQDDKIFVKDVNDLVTEVTIPKATSGASQVIMTNEPIVKVGDEVIPNQVVATPTMLKSGSYELGRNANAVYMNYLGYSYEDGVIVSQSYADKMTHYTMVDVTKTLKPGEILKRLEIPGKRVKSLDFLVAGDTELRADPNTKRSLETRIDQSSGDGKGITSIINPRTNRTNLVVPNNISEGYIVDVRIDKNPSPKERSGVKRTIKLSDYTMKVLAEYENSKEKSNDYLALPEKYRNLKAPRYSNFRNSDDIAITYRIVVKHPMTIGDKSTNSYGSKGIVSLILPDDCMPRIDTDGHGNGPIFDIIMNPAAVVSRKNASQLYEVLLTKCIHAIYDTLNTQLNKNLKPERIMTWKQWTEPFYGNKFLKMTDEEFIEAAKDINSFRMDVGSYAKISYDKVLEWADSLGVKEDDNIYVPDVVIYQDADGTKACSPEYAKEHGIHGKYYELGFVETPVVTGYSYMYKLYKSAKLDGKVTPNEIISGYPLLGKGLIRYEGQKIGEMELWALQSSGATKLVTHNNPDIERIENLFIDQMLLTGFVLTGKNGLPFNTEYEYKADLLKKKLGK